MGFPLAMTCSLASNLAPWYYYFTKIVPHYPCINQEIPWAQNIRILPQKRQPTDHVKARDFLFKLNSKKPAFLQQIRV